MPKPVPITPEVMEATVTPRTAPPTPPAAAPASAPPKSKRAPAAARKQPQIPLQLRLPRDEVRAIKIAAAEREQTVSDFMLACFHANMKTVKHA
jgi:hypothetical protein